MPTPPSWQQLYDAAKAEIQARNPSLSDWSEGSRLDATTGAAAVLADQLIEFVVRNFAAQFVDTAQGADLDALALDRFLLTRQAATPSIGYLTWTKDPDAPTLAYTIPAGFVFSGSVNGERISVESTGEVSVGTADLTVQIPCESTVTGPAQNVAADVIDTLETNFPSDPNATVTNADRFVGGSNAETDAEFRDRIRRFFKTVVRGTVSALRAGARSVPGVRFVTVDESEVEAAGTVNVYVGDPDANSNDVLADLVATELEDWRAAGVLVEVVGAERDERTAELTVYVRAGADTDTLRASIRSVSEAYADTLGPGDTFYRSRLSQLAHNVSSDVVGVDVTKPADDVAPSQPYQAIRLPAEAVTVTFVEV
ncbi:MAG TPA: baseplate J/gp47 family protein [Phycisphaerales bacterium]|nr:baseplate J/gp47 family protein [Phycisphaerales bacterium]